MTSERVSNCFEPVNLDAFISKQQKGRGTEETPCRCSFHGSSSRRRLGQRTYGPLEREDST